LSGYRTIEHKQLAAMILKIVNHLVDRAPEGALPFLVPKDKIREIARWMIGRLSTEDLLDLSLLSYMELDQMFQNISKDWMLERLGVIKRSKFIKTRKALEDRGIDFFNV